ncbi:MAG: hypothetical protein FJ112_09130 [Deltaproteobacteria bacterium]|nr:hypothetical protein [Deltaproteobacteria bacterium]
MKDKFIFWIFVCFLAVNSLAFSMDFSLKKVAVWKRGESMAGEEFIAANESVVDYLATLKRPTEPFKIIVYQCQVKYRDISPTVQNNNASTNITNSYLFIRTVYDIKDCILVD